MLRAAAVCLFAIAALAQPARADWPFEQGRQHHREAVKLPTALGNFLDHMGGRARASSGQPSADINSNPAPRYSAFRVWPNKLKNTN